MAGTTTTTTTPGEVTLLTEREAVKRYAGDLMEKSWCIDVSASPVKALHADSNHNAAVENFRYEFPMWAARTGVRVDAKEYAAFLSSLVQKLIPHLPRVVGQSLRPIPDKFFDRNGAMFANTFVPFAPEVPDQFVMPEVLEDFLSRVFMNDQDRKWVTQWLADIVQNPARRPQWAVVLTGDQGTGKSSIFRLASAALGYRHTWDHNQYTPAFKQFSEVFPDNLLVCFDDATARADTYENLKQAITRDSQWVELKAVQKPVQREVYARILVCSNSPRPLVIEEGDRRLYVTERSRHKVSPEETAAFFVRFNKWVEQPSTPAVLYHWLKSIDLIDFVPGSTVKTETHAKMVGLSASVLDTLLAEYVADAPIFHNQSLLDYLGENGCRHPKPDLIKMKMAGLNYEHKQRGRKVAGCGDKQIPLWQPICPRARPLTQAEEECIRSVVAPSYENA